MRTIDPSDEDFSDLDAFGELVGGARVVQIGEQCHGDGATFLAKTRLIKFLHQRMGFDVLAWESGIFDCHLAWEAFRRGDDPMEAAGLGIFDTWRSHQVKPMFEYLSRCANTDRPLELFGMDSQFSGRASKASVADEIESRVSKAAGDHVRLAMTRGAEIDEDEATSVMEEIDAASAKEGDPFWRQCLRSIAANLRAGQAARQKDVTAYSVVRDRQMGENLVWAANEGYPGKRIVVWADTGHISNGFDKLDLGVATSTLTPEQAQALADQMKNFRTQGQHSKAVLGDDLLTICTAAARGSVGRSEGPPATLGTIPLRDLDEPPPGSFEDLFLQAGLDNAVIDLRDRAGDGNWLRDSRSARFLAYAWREGEWPAFADMVLFTENMFPSEAIPLTTGRSD
jgi:erythromycin esterase